MVAVVSHHPDIDELVGLIEASARLVLRAPDAEKLSLTSLGVMKTLERQGPLRMTQLARMERLTQPSPRRRRS